MIVVDASATTDYLLGTVPEGIWVMEQLRLDDDVHAPHLVDVEVAQTMRRLVRAAALSDSAARRALAELGALALVRYPHQPFLERIWRLRDNLSAYDATYVALAETLGAALVTTDLRLGRAPGIRAAVLTP